MTSSNRLSGGGGSDGVIGSSQTIGGGLRFHNAQGGIPKYLRRGTGGGAELGTQLPFDHASPESPGLELRVGGWGRGRAQHQASWRGTRLEIGREPHRGIVAGGGLDRR